jgi:5-dehydro-2-deoxygluconokinase
MLGLDAPEETLRRAFEDVAGVELCRGFAVGRSIFNTAARAWFNGTLSNEAATEDIAERYRRLIVSWREARN